MFYASVSAEVKVIPCKLAPSLNRAREVFEIACKVSHYVGQSQTSAIPNNYQNPFKIIILRSKKLESKFSEDDSDEEPLISMALRGKSCITNDMFSK